MKRRLNPSQIARAMRRHRASAENGSTEDTLRQRNALNENAEFTAWPRAISHRLTKRGETPMPWLRQPTESGYWWWRFNPTVGRGNYEVLWVEPEPNVRLIFQAGHKNAVDLDEWLKEYPAGEWQQVKEPDAETDTRAA